MGGPLARARPGCSSLSSGLCCSPRIRDLRWVPVGAWRAASGTTHVAGPHLTTPHLVGQAARRLPGCRLARPLPIRRWATISAGPTPLSTSPALRGPVLLGLFPSVPSVSGCLPTGPLSPRPRRLVVVVVVAVVAVLCCGLCWPWEPPGQWRPGRTAGPHSSHESRVPICSAGAQLRPSTRHRAGPPQRRCSSRSRPGTRCQGS